MSEIRPLSLADANSAETLKPLTTQRQSSNERLKHLADKAAAAKNELEEHATSQKVSQTNTASHLSGLKSELSEAIQTLNDSLAKALTKAQISHDDTLNRYVVKIADRESGEIVREIPSEELLKLARHLEKLRGILFDKTA